MDTFSLSEIHQSFKPIQVGCRPNQNNSIKRITVSIIDVQWIIGSDNGFALQAKNEVIGQHTNLLFLGLKTRPVNSDIKVKYGYHITGMQRSPHCTWQWLVIIQDNNRRHKKYVCIANERVTHDGWKYIFLSLLKIYVTVCYLGSSVMYFLFYIHLRN